MRLSLCGPPMENMDWARVFDTWKSTKNRRALPLEFITKRPISSPLMWRVGVVTPSRRSDRIASPWRKVWHPFVAFSENGEWRMKEATPGEKQEACGEPSPRILHSLPAEEKKLGFPFSENRPSAIQFKERAPRHHENGRKEVWQPPSVFTTLRLQFMQCAV